MSPIPDAPYTQSRAVQYRGPSTSDDYNARLEENYRDLMVLFNRARLSNELVREFYRRVVKEQLDLMRVVEDLESRVAAVEADATTLSFFSDAQVDTDRFNSTSFNVNPVGRCTVDSRYGLVVLPRVESSSLSKLAFTDGSGETRLPASLQTAVTGIAGADQAAAVIDTSPPEFAIRGGIGRIWERNVIVNAPNVDPAQMNLYVQVPTDLFTTDKSNVLTLHPFPLMGADIVAVAVTNNVNPTMTDSDGYTPVNSGAFYSGQPAAVGWVAPGGWSGDTILRAGPKKFYFDPQTVTGFRLTLQQRGYYAEGGQYVYSYGASLVNLGFEKFLDSGQLILRFDAPVATTISSVSNVLPQIFNVAESELPDVFSYQVIWETSFGSGVYTTTPVALSQRIWIAVTLNMTVAGGSPGLSGLTVTYA